MSWRGQGGRRAKGRRGDRDPEFDNTAWLAELERQAAQADDDEDDWASTLRSRRSTASPASPPPRQAAQAPPPAAADPGWTPPDPAPSHHRLHGMDPAGPDPAPASSPWLADPVPQDPYAAPQAPDPDWSWRPPASEAYRDPAAEAFGDPRQGAGPEPDWSGPPAAPADGGWQPDGADTATGLWSPDPAGPEAGYQDGRNARYREPSYPADPAAYDPTGQGGGDPAGREPGHAAGDEPDYPVGREPDYPVGREPDYPALFGELYRRSAGQQDPIWEAPPAVEPMPEPGPAEAAPAAWPFEETTQSWEPSDRSFVWPADELPSASAEWDQPDSASWLDEPDPWPPAPPSPAPPLDQTAAWPAAAGPPSQGPAPGAPVSPPPLGPPPADWAAAIPTDVPAARRAADPDVATRMWRPDDVAEPRVPVGSRAAPAAGPAAGTATPWARRGDRGLDEEPAEARRKERSPRPRDRQGGARQARAWPRVVAIISWIVLVMVVCWFYVFPWLERVLPESF